MLVDGIFDDKNNQIPLAYLQLLLSIVLTSNYFKSNILLSITKENERYEGPSLCQWYTSCDHAVIISASWNIQQADHENIQLFQQMLQNNGFHADKINVFQHELPFYSKFVPAA